ncbi:MAG: hypothetical protein R2697_09505 [Ilumatobacteraceae bacterium]
MRVDPTSVIGWAAWRGTGSRSELVPDDASGRRPHQRPHEVGSQPTSGDALEAETPTDGDLNDRGGDQRRTVAIAAGVGLVALLLGWVVGRAGGSSDTATAPATTVDVTVPRTTAAPTDDEPRDTIAPVDDPVSRPTLPLVTWPANASDLVENGATITTTKVGIDERLAGQDVVLVGLVGDGLAELDLGGSTVTDYTLDGLPRSYGPTIVAGADWIVIPMYNGQDPFLVFDDGTVERPDLMPGGNQLLHVTGTDLFWRMPAYWSSTASELGQVDVAGEPTGVTLELPTNVWPAFADPLGGVIVQASGRWFSVDTEGSSSIGTGDVIALDDDIVLLHDCVALDECGLWRIDRSTGEAAPVPVDLSRLDSPYIGASWWNGDAGSGLSPDAPLRHHHRGRRCAAHGDHRSGHRRDHRHRRRPPRAADDGMDPRRTVRRVPALRRRTDGLLGRDRGDVPRRGRRRRHRLGPAHDTPLAPTPFVGQANIEASACSAAPMSSRGSWTKRLM